MNAARVPVCRQPASRLVQATAPATYSGKWGEVALHRHVGELLEVFERQGRLIAIPVPNGAMLAGKNLIERSKRAKRMKADRQIRPGVSDWLIYLKNGPLVAIELKVGKNKPTDEQAAFGAQVELMGGMAFVCRSIDEVMAAVGGLQSLIAKSA